jgi:hypothetical protein
MRWIVKRCIVLLLFSGVIVVPLLLMNTTSEMGSNTHSGAGGTWQRMTQWFGDVGDSITVFFSSDSDTDANGVVTQESMLTVNPTGNNPHLDGGVIGRLEDVINMNITPKWITQRWARVSTNIQSGQWQGYRVPIVTGEKTDDLAGALTYYFDNQQQLQRIAFRGTTGESQKIITLLQQQFHLTKRPTSLIGLYIKSQNRRPVSVLMITRSPPAATQNNAARYSQYTIQFELNRPSIGAQLSDRYQNILAAE